MARKATTTKATPKMSGAAKTQVVGDTLQNLLTGMGTERDKNTATRFGFTTMDKAQLDAAYKGDWIARKVIDIPAYDGTREWRSWQADPDDITQIEEVEKNFRIQRKVMLARQRARLYGGGALIMGVSVGQPDQELLPEQVTLGALKWVHAVSRHDLTCGAIDWNVDSPYYGEPAYYTASNPQGASVKLHPSRVVRFVGLESADLTKAQGWGDSILEVVQDAILSTGTVLQSVAQLVQEAKLDIVKIPEMSEQLVNAEYEARLAKRFAVANTLKSLYSILIVDKEEDWERIDANFTALPDVLKMYLLVASGAADIPATRMFGQSPAGLSATGDSDTRNYYDRVAAEQKTDVAPALKRLDDVLLMSTLGAIPDGIFYNWNPLWQMTEAEKSDIAVKKANVMTADVNAGLLDSHVLKAARENQLIEDGTYPGLEGFIEEFDGMDEEQAANAPPPANENDPNAPPVLDPKTGEPIVQDPKAPPVAAPKPKPTARASAVAAKNKAANDMRDRIAKADLSDGTPRTLYMRRDLINTADFVKWAKSQGFDTTVADLHVTITYSRQPVDWLKVGEPWNEDKKTGNLIVAPGGPRIVEEFGDAVVLAFACTDLQWRHEAIKERAGASWDYDDYIPHVTITYNKPAGMDVNKLEPYRGGFVFGPEIFEEIKDFTVVEK